MFYSHNVEASKFRLFTTLVSTLLDGKEEYKGLVDGVIKEAHSYCAGMKSIYSIEKENAPIVLFLSQADSSYFQVLENKSLNKEDYEHVFEILSESKIEEWTNVY